MKDENGYMKGVSRAHHILAKVFLGKRLKLSDKVRLSCPRCCSKMDVVHKEGVVIDVCPFCKGLFLDDGEIEKLSGMAQEKGLAGFKRTKNASKSSSKTSRSKTTRKNN